VQAMNVPTQDPLVVVESYNSGNLMFASALLVMSQSAECVRIPRGQLQLLVMSQQRQCHSGLTWQ
jgi:hypothetical protein